MIEVVTGLINARNVGRIAERIVANELEFRGFRVSDFNKDGLSATADLIASKDAKTYQIQVKGATNGPGDKRDWIRYGYCDDGRISDGSLPIFNRREGFYRSEFVVVVAVRSPSKYTCIVLPVADAERAAQLNLDRGYRTPKLNGEPKKPGKIWVHLEPSDRSRTESPILKNERKILSEFRDIWQIIQ